MHGNNVILWLTGTIEFREQFSQHVDIDMPSANEDVYRWEKENHQADKIGRKKYARVYKSITYTTLDRAREANCSGVFFFFRSSRVRRFTKGSKPRKTRVKVEVVELLFIEMYFVSLSISFVINGFYQ